MLLRGIGSILAPDSRLECALAENSVLTFLPVERVAMARAWDALGDRLDGARRKRVKVRVQKLKKSSRLCFSPPLQFVGVWVREPKIVLFGWGGNNNTLVFVSPRGKKRSKKRERERGKKPCTRGREREALNGAIPSALSF